MSDLDLAVGLASEAAALAELMARRGFETWEKSPGNPVTDADLAVDRFLRDALAAHRPEDAWLSEETADDPARLANARVWIVDPIDGTRDFARGRPGWCVSVALAEHGEVLAAALAAPRRAEIYAAAKGGGATLNGAPIRASGRTEPDGMRIPIDPPALRMPFARGLGLVATEKPNSIALRAALVADGRADALLAGRTTNEWDLAACALIATEAGATVTDRDGASLRFNVPGARIPGIVCATPALHGHALGLLARARGAAGG